MRFVIRPPFSINDQHRVEKPGLITRLFCFCVSARERGNEVTEAEATADDQPYG